MSTFDGWETQLYGDVMALPTKDELMHFRTKGSKNGVRRYQTESGEWTPLGLKERKAREGWGDSRAERKANKAVAKAEKRAAKAERKAEKYARKTAKVDARKAKIAAKNEKKRLGDITKLTDEELQKKIARVKMEQEYKELTRSPLLKNGEKLVSSILEAKAKAADRADARAKLALDSRRVEADIIKAKENTKRAKADAAKAKEDRKKMAQDRKAGLADERAAELQKAKTAYRETTIRGGIARRINSKLNAGYKEMVQSERRAKGEAAANRIKSNEAYKLSKDNKARDLKDRNKGIKEYEAEQRRQRKEREKTKKEYERRMKKLGGSPYRNGLHL